MEKRIPLKNSSELIFTNRSGSRVCLFVDDVLEFGGTCIVYNGHYINSASQSCPVRIKECYPYRLHITRAQDGILSADAGENESFLKYKEQMRKSFVVSAKLHNTSGLTNVTTNMYDCYEKNNTVYIVSSYVDGETLNRIHFETVHDAIRVAIGIAKGIQKIHEQGYLYLDLKPENVFVYRETPDLIQLFDFDSMIPFACVKENANITSYRMSYSAGFAPIEQKLGDLESIGAHTDVYSLGAVLYYLLFGRIFHASMAESIQAENIVIQKGVHFQPKVYKELGIFFKKTLQSYYKDRYQTMDEAICQLKEIEKYIDMPTPFICSGFIEKDERVIGRDKECRAILEWYRGNEKLLCVTGTGGIGKSTVVRRFISENRALFDNVVYLKYNNSLQETIVDDTLFNINFCYRYEEESDEEYCTRKMQIAQSIVKEQPTLLVIDNYAGKLYMDVDMLSVVEWKIIIITRKNVDNKAYHTERIMELASQKEKYALVELNMGRRLCENEYAVLDKIIELVKGHTLILTLIAKQISKSYLDMECALQLILQSGFSEMAPEKIRYVQDGSLFYGQMAAFITSVYDTSKLSDKEKCFVKVLSLFGSYDVDVKTLKDIFEFATFDEMNGLSELGFIDIIQGEVSMHPLIQEAVKQIEWDDKAREYAESVLLWLCDKCDKKNNRRALDISRTVVKNADNDIVLQQSQAYKELTFLSVIKSSKDYENFIIPYACKLMADNDLKPEKIIRLYDYVVYILCQRRDFDKARTYIMQTEKFAKEQRNHYIWCLYYDMLSDYQDALLDGAYFSADSDEKMLYNAMLKSVDRAIHHAKYAKESGNNNAKELYTKYLIDKAALCVRGMSENKAYIRRLILKAKQALIQYEIKDTVTILSYLVTCAWYCTFYNSDQRRVIHFLQKAQKVVNEGDISALDSIDYFYIPAANMMLELYDCKASLEWLDIAVKICGEHAGAIPFERKKHDLIKYEAEVRNPV